MSKYEVELDDAEARAFVYDLRNDGSGLEKAVANQIERQIPLPAPSKIGAVVRTVPTAESSKFQIWVLWKIPGLWMTPEDEGGNAYLTREIGRITEVLSPGVDL